MPGWQIGETRAYLVRGWSAYFGHDWSEVIAWSSFYGFNVFGQSDIGTGLGGGEYIPPWPVFSPTIAGAITNGFTVYIVPEPSAVAVAAVCVTVVFLRRKFPVLPP